MKRKIKTHRVESLTVAYFTRVQKICSKKLYRDVLRDYFEMAANKIIEGEYFKLPQGLGTLKITKNNPSQAPVDHNRSKIFKRKVQFLSFDTDRKVFKWKWDSKRAIFKNNRLWRFYSLYRQKKKITNRVREGNAFYFRNEV